MHGIRQSVRGWRSPDVHESHPETERALGTDTEVLEEKEYTGLAVLILETLCICRKGTDEGAGVRMSGQKRDRMLAVAFAWWLLLLLLLLLGILLFLLLLLLLVLLVLVLVLVRVLVLLQRRSRR